MRVVAKERDYPFDDVIPLVKGNVYTVVDKNIVKKRQFVGLKAGLYFKLLETGMWYHHSLFVVINEDQQDETEFERSELVKEMKS